MTAKEAIDIVADICGTIGSDDSEAIEIAIVSLREIAEWLNNVDNDNNANIAEIARLNEKVFALQKANNQLVRSVAVQAQANEETEVAIEDELNQFF